MTSEGIMILFILAVIFLGVCLFHKDRKVSVTVIENLPPWIFKKGEREEYSKNCELKSARENVDNIFTEEHINTQEEIINENVSAQKEDKVLNEEIPVIREIQEGVNHFERIEGNSIKKDLSKDSENEQSEANKPKFITNSMSMLKDYEKLLDKLEENENSIDKERGSNEIKSTLGKAAESSVENNTSKKEETVYWTNSGRTYHRKRSCISLTRSKIVHRGTIEESKKLAACSKCK